MPSTGSDRRGLPGPACMSQRQATRGEYVQKGQPRLLCQCPRFAVRHISAEDGTTCAAWHVFTPEGHSPGFATLIDRCREIS
ncbi:MAG TPA: hypothetical protein DEF41_10825 [Desulfovibrio sp.]|nr:hypothetical protein [Desulfovibrio sp.]